MQISAAESLTQAAPNGVDCFFDNVGGSESSVILSRMNTFGRIAVCGAISTYNDKQVATAPVIQGSLVTKVRYIKLGITIMFQHLFCDKCLIYFWDSYQCSFFLSHSN